MSDVHESTGNVPIVSLHAYAFFSFLDFMTTRTVNDTIGTVTRLVSDVHEIKVPVTFQLFLCMLCLCFFEFS